MTRRFLIPLVVALAALLWTSPASAVPTSSDPNYTSSVLTTGLAGPANGVVYRSATNDVLVSEFGASKVTKVDASSGAKALFATVPSPDEMAINSSGHVYVKEHPSGPIHRFSSTGAPLSPASFPAPCAGPAGIAFDSADNFYVACFPGGTIFKFAAGTFTSPTVYASGFPSLEGMDFSPADKLFVTDFLGGRVFEVTPGGTTLSSHTQWASGLTCPLNVGFDPLSGDVFASSGDRLVRMPSPGTVITFATGFTGGCAGAYDLDFDPTGCLYADDFTMGLIAKFCPKVGPPANLTLTPKTAKNEVGSQHCVTATVTDTNGKPVPGVTVRFSASGANSASGTAATDANGQAKFCYIGTNAGNDTIKAYADTNNNSVQDANEPADTATKAWVPGPPATLTLDPKSATNPVDSKHCVTATVKDKFGNPTPGINVVFTVTGSVNTGGTVVTNANGQATFCYVGPALPGADLIKAFADTNKSGTQDVGEPFDTADKKWVLPMTTPGCEIKITNGGWIIANNGDRASFGGNAKADTAGNVTGNEEYQDHGPAEPFNLHGNVLVIVCNPDGKSGTIFGDATIDGMGSHMYRIDVTDNAEPGRGADHYRMRVETYDSGDQVLKGGNIQVHKN
jgi:Big-like domain-containing protein